MLSERLSNALKNHGRKRWNINKLKNEDDPNLYHPKINERLEDMDGYKMCRQNGIQLKCNNRGGE
jgi:hypothetical protein